MQTRLTKAGFDTGGNDGRVGNDTMKAVKDYQARMGLLPADGYGGLKVACAVAARRLATHITFVIPGRA